MKKLLEYLPFHFTLSLIIGIATQFKFRIWSFGFFEIAYVAISLFIGIFLLRKSKFYFLVIWMFFFLIGVIAVFVHNKENYRAYFGNHDLSDASFVLRIDRQVNSSKYYQKYEATVLQVNQSHTIGAILLHIKKDTITDALDTGSIIITKQEAVRLKSPLNPYQFDYKSYLYTKGISFQIFIRDPHEYVQQGFQFSLLAYAEGIRNHLQRALKKRGFKKDVFGVMNALLLGERKEVSKELIDDFTKAGAIHILAVSGLHVGILFLILSHLFKPMERWKKGRLYKTLLVIVSLWMFALIAGLSASVVRAVTMFTFIAIGKLSNRPSGVMHSLIASMFILLLLKPLFLWDVGFQLSYLAVFGIVWIQPKLYQFWKPRNRIADKAWQLTTVSISAQLMVLPLSLYYFHQFPGLFVLSNLIVVPFLGLILSCGILILLLSTVDWLPAFMVDAYSAVIDGLNLFVSWVASQEAFLLVNISFSELMICVTYFGIICFIRLLYKWQPVKIILALSAFICFQSVNLIELNDMYSEKELIIFHELRKTVIGKRMGNELFVYGNPKTTEEKIPFSIKRYKVGSGVTVEFKEYFPHFYRLRDHMLILVDKKGIYEYEKKDRLVIMLTSSPKINLDRLIHRLHPSLIIADGSNYNNFISKWRNTCIKTKTPFWYTGQNGAYIVKE